MGSDASAISLRPRVLSPVLNARVAELAAPAPPVGGRVEPHAGLAVPTKRLLLRTAFGAAAGAALGLWVCGGGTQAALAGSTIGGAIGAAWSAVDRLREAGRRSALPDPPSRTLDEIRAMAEYNWQIPSRNEQIARLKNPSERWDLIVIGGGATGAGTALEAAGRGLRVAAVEAGDFASGTSSRSTKLIHGGVRYLEKAVKHLDGEQYALVKEGLEERKSFLHMAPHLTGEVRLVTPCYRRWEVPYYYMALTLYDWIAGSANLQATRVLSPEGAAARVPGVRRDGLRGAVEYSDGEFNDARMNVSLALTAAAHGAAIANYVEVQGLIREGGRVVGAQVRDRRSGDTWTLRGHVVVNATGPFIDRIRRMEAPDAAPLAVPSAGTHIFVKKLQLPNGILIPQAPNGSVAFFKPFEGGTLVGTTEEDTELTTEPRVRADQVEYLRLLANRYLDAAHQVQPQDVTAAWSGIRPLVRDPERPLGTGGTVNLSRKHIVHISDGGLVTIGGGKWTSFGRMAQDAVDAAIERGGLNAVGSRRNLMQVVGAHGYSSGLAGALRTQFGLAPDVAAHLAHNYGDRAVRVAELAAQGFGERLHPDHPYLEAEVIHAVRSEYAVDPVDVLSRRTRMSFVDEAATFAALPRVVELMADTLHWDEETAARNLAQARAFYDRNRPA